jgi:hypothetical protein
MNYLEEFNKIGKNTEIPGIFTVWGGVASLSAVLGRRIYIDMGSFTIYPNLFVILVAGSGKCRKSTAIEMVEDRLLPFADEINMLVSKGTFQGIVDDLVEKGGNDGPHEGYMLLDEVTTLLNKQSWEGRVGELIHQLVDCKKTFEARTRGKGKEKLKDTCLGALGATTVELIRDAIPPQMIGAGLSSRMVFVYTDQPGPPCPFPKMTDEKRNALRNVHQKLNESLMLSGEVKLSREAEEYYSKQYVKHRNGTYLWDDPCLAGYASRRYVFVLKLAMILSVAESPQLIIEKRHVAGAENLLFDTEQGLQIVIGKMSQTESGNETDYVKQIIFHSPGNISRSELLRKVQRRMNSEGLDKVINTLRQSEEIEITSNGRAIYYSPK